MKRSTELSNRLREVFLTGKWIANTNYLEQISSISWQQAIQKMGNHNTIAALIFHSNYYTKGIQQVLDGGDLEIKDEYSFDIPPLKSASDYESLVNEFKFHAEKFANTVAQLADETLDAPFVNEKYGTYLRNIEGVLEHSYYHLGQITLIKKLIVEK